MLPNAHGHQGQIGQICSICVKDDFHNRQWIYQLQIWCGASTSCVTCVYRVWGTHLAYLGLAKFRLQIKQTDLHIWQFGGGGGDWYNEQCRTHEYYCMKCKTRWLKFHIKHRKRPLRPQICILHGIGECSLFFWGGGGIEKTETLIFAALKTWQCSLHKMQDFCFGSWKKLKAAKFNMELSIPFRRVHIYCIFSNVEHWIWNRY